MVILPLSFSSISYFVRNEHVLGFGEKLLSRYAATYDTKKLLPSSINQAIIHQTYVHNFNLVSTECLVWLDI